jgi:hypothetical protein
LEGHSVAPDDNQVHAVTAAIARYKGPRLVPWSILESLLNPLGMGPRTSYSSA